MFSNDGAEKAARDANAGATAGYNQLSDLYGQGRGVLSSSLAQGRDALTSATGSGINALNSSFGQGRGDLTNSFGQGRGALTTGFDQGRGALSNSFGLSRDALNTLFGQGRDAISTSFGQGRDALSQNFGAAGDLYKNLMTSYAPGAQAYGDATGANGSDGYVRAKTNFQTDPGYGFQMDQGQQALNRAHAAAGNLSSGNADADTLKFSQGLADQSYGNYVSRLLPYFNGQQTATAGAAGVNTGLGTGLNQSFDAQGNAINSSFGTQGQNVSNNYTTEGAGLNTSYQGEGTGVNTSYQGEGTGLNTSRQGEGTGVNADYQMTGSGLNSNYGNLATGLSNLFSGQGNAANTTQTTIGNNNAGADLNNYKVGANLWNGIMGGANFLAGGTGGQGGVNGLAKNATSLFSAFK